MTLYELLRELKLCRHFFTQKQYCSLKRQAVRGDVAGAEKELEKLLRNRRDGNNHGTANDNGTDWDDTALWE